MPVRPLQIRPRPIHRNDQPHPHPRQRRDRRRPPRRGGGGGGAGQAGRAKLISLDPGQTKWAFNVGRHVIARSGFEPWHEFIEDYDYNALPALMARGIKADLGYIDGWHTFDYTLLDIFYIDKLLRPGGIMGINDGGQRPVARAIRWLLTHRRYEEIDVGLAPDYKSRLPGGALIKRWQGRNNADRYFRKVEQWEPDWDFYAPF